jgi:hypothetical protein
LTERQAHPEIEPVFYDAISEFPIETAPAVEGMQLPASQQTTLDDDYLFGRLSDLERLKIMNLMDVKSRALFAVTNKEASELVRQRIAEENELVAEVLNGIENAADYDMNYGNPPASINRPLNSHNITAVHLAAQYGKVDLVRRLVSMGGDLNVKDVAGRTPLLMLPNTPTLKLWSL